MVLLVLVLAALTPIYGHKLKDQKHINSIEYSFISPRVDLELETNNSDQLLRYSPDVATSSNIGLNFKSFGISASFKNPNESDNEQSEYNDYTIRSPIANGIFEVTYSRFKGFKVNGQSSKDLLPITSESYGVSYTFFINKNVEILQNLGHFVKDKANDYGAFASIGFTKNMLNSRDTLVSSTTQSFKDFSGLRSFEQDSIYATYGIAGSATFKNIYFQGAIGLGMNLSQIQYEGSNLKNSTKTGPTGKSQFNLGYQFNNSILGIEANLTRISDLQSNSELSISKTDVHIYYHYFF